MKLLQLQLLNTEIVGLVNVLDRVTNEQIENAHLEFVDYCNELNDDDERDSFEEWCKIHYPQFGLQRVFADEVTVDENLI